jgi:aspartate-semialdehyde dehydrogenase
MRSAAIPRIGVIGATGAVGTVTLQLLAERGFDDIRAFASSRSAGKRVPYGNAELEVEEATPEALGGGDLDLCFFSVGTEASHELVPPAALGGAVCIDKSDAFRLTEGVPLVVAGVNDEVLNGDEIVANPNCSAIQLACVLKPLSDAAGLASVRLATYQSMSGAGDAGIERLRATQPMEADLAMDWDLEGDEFSEESKLRAETRKILGLPDVPIQAIHRRRGWRRLSRSRPKTRASCWRLHLTSASLSSPRPRKRPARTRSSSRASGRT